MKIAVAVLAFVFSICSQAEPLTDDLLNATAKAVEDQLAKDKSAFAHARREPNQTPAAARQMINMWIRFNMQNAFEAKAKGSMKEALFFMFTARHALRDATSPEANDANGEPAIANGDISKTHAIVALKGGWRERVDEDIQSMFERGVVPAGDLLKMYGIDSETGPTERANQLPRPNFVKQ